MADKLQQQLVEVGSKLETPPPSKDALLRLLKQAASSLSEMEQSPSTLMLESMQPFLNAIVKPELLRHQDRDVKLLVATCICEITRITAPEAPYSDDVLKDIFHLTVGTFSGLSDTSGASFGRRVIILETLAKYRSCVVMLDLECNDLVNKMFRTFFTVASDDHQESVLSSMQTIMVLLIDESEDVREDLVLVILSALGRNRSDVSAASRRLAMNIIEHCAGKLEASIKQYLISSMSGDNRSENSQIDCHEVIYDIYRCAPQILSGVMPYLTGELLTDQLDTRLKAVTLVGDLFALPDSVITEAFQPIFLEFLKRLTDRVVAVRMSVLGHVKDCLLSNPTRAEAPQIISALCDRLLDYDENIRKQVVDVICDVACKSLYSIPAETIKLVGERLRDKSLLVKRNTMERLAEVFRICCVKFSEAPYNSVDYEWIPGKILRCLYDKDFRSDTIESVLCGTLFPADFSVKDRVKHWVRLFSVFDKVEVKALEKILEQKQRVQQEMQRYLSLRQTHKKGDAPELQKKIMLCFRIMSRSFAEPLKAEENFLTLDQLKDANIWKILTNLLDPKTSFHQATIGRDDLLKILGEKHRLYEFFSSLSIKCSYLLFNKEHVKEILVEAITHNSAGNAPFIQSCMDLLVILARFSPLLLSGSEEELVNFLKNENEIIKEGALHVLAKAGGAIREQLAVTSSSIDLILERLCLEGSRRQAKFAVHALAAITKDDGLKSLSVLYKRLVDMMGEERHLPAVLQSLGCIAQAAMPVFETRETEVEEFIKSKILEHTCKMIDEKRTSWDDRSEVCLLKIYGLKTLVKSYLPVKDAQLRPGIDDLLQILRNLLRFGEVSKDIESSAVDKAHLKLAAAKAVLRLSKQWDHKIPVDVFHLTLRVPEIDFSQARKLFLCKVHQYIKDRLLDAKYACAFFFNTIGSTPQDCEEEKQNLADLIQMYYQAKARQVPVQTDTNPSAVYPEYLLPYLVHALAHNSSPSVDECKDVKAFEPMYRKLYLILSLLVHKDEDVKLEASTNKEKESIHTIVSLLHSIKSSEDAVDAAKSKNSYALCELGLSIIKRLMEKEENLEMPTSLVPLPAVLYKPLEKKEADDSLTSEGKTWLSDEGVMSHFESLKLVTDVTITTDLAEDEVVKDSEAEENEVPLGKMMKQLKAQGAKGAKVKKNKSLSAETNNAESDVDILTMVREINLDNLGSSTKFDTSNGHKHLASEETKSDLDLGKDKKRKDVDAASVPIPKRRRSTAHSAVRLAQSPFKASSKASGGESSPDSRKKKTERKQVLEGSESEFLVPIRKNCSPLKSRGKSSGLIHELKEHNILESDEDDLVKDDTLVDSDDADRNNNLKSSAGSMKSRKRKIIAGLVKCTTKESDVDVAELIGRRIKVWWPMDKKFYEGTIKSYDPLKGKHVILYNDGDIEVLRLDKERWEVVHSGRKPAKKLSKQKPSSDLSPAKKRKAPASSRQNRKSVTIVKRKRTPKKNSKHAPKEQTEMGDSDASDNGLPMEEDKTRSGDSQEDLPDVDESGKEVTSASRGKHTEDTDDSSHHPEDSDGEMETNYEDKLSDNEETEVQDQKDDAGEESQSEEMNDDKSDSEGNNHADDENLKDSQKSSSESHPLDADAEISDDEPLCNWKQKAASKRAR